ncbi:MAG: hypothetical protein GXY55_08040 [Phycisphaerae bacterium]|nr:hypothetical protein [Phycisphaerae bacterium]
MSEQEDELEDRVCRACHQTYRYPIRKSSATRSHCETCANLPPSVRSTLEKLTKRVTQLTSRVEKLESGRQ